MNKLNKPFHALNGFKLDSPCIYIHPRELPEITHIDDPAHEVMLDFKYHIPPTINAHQSLEEARLEMEIYHLPVLLVVNYEKKTIGVISSEDILGEKPVKISQEKRIPRNEIEVEMIMLPFKNAIALQWEDLTHAKVGHIIQTFRQTKQHTLLVIHDNKLRGLFSASIISRQLDKDITEVMSEAESIAELQQDLHH